MPIETVYEPEPVQHLSILDIEGQVDKTLDPKVPKEDLLKLYESMVTSRQFDLRRLKLQRQGRIGTFAPAHGQEAAQAGSIYTIRDNDWFVPSFRESVCFQWRGAKLSDDLLYCAGFEEGMQLDVAHKNLPICIPIGTQYTHALGVAWAEKLKGTDNIAIVYGGDGSTSEGDFHEAVNMAAVFAAPVVFFIQNNQWAISVPRAHQTKAETLAQKAIAYEIPTIQVDGNDLLAVVKATRDAVAHCRAGKGPYFIEAVTYRMSVHTTADDPRKYRSKEEEEAWIPKDPIERVRKYLVRRRLWNATKEDDLQERVKARIDAAVVTFEARKKELEHDIETIFAHAYLENPPYLQRQHDALRAHYDAVGGPKTEAELHSLEHGHPAESTRGMATVDDVDGQDAREARDPVEAEDAASGADETEAEAPAEAEE